jgi:hypothetical protein
MVVFEGELLMAAKLPRLLQAAGCQAHDYVVTGGRESRG